MAEDSGLLIDTNCPCAMLPPKRTLTDELNEMMDDLEGKVPCWKRRDDFPDPPHWTTKAWRCAFQRRKK